ncbi:MAG: DsbA family protein [Roseitalea porphyridii]|jgi:protein-disulfide isomerase|uniref:DsbA family protein n=1 Tax=Roseitalea porphyridii TaxID=1852022 RepID=UPI0032EC36A7
MIARLTRTVLATLIGLAMFAGPSAAQAFDEAQREEIGEIVRDYLLANPEVMIEVQEALEARQVAEEDERRREIITSAADDLFRNPSDPVLGNPAGDITVVEFFDYNCGFCRRALDDMNKLIESDPNLRFVLKEFPILGEDSNGAHQVALAFNRVMPQAYGEFHERLMMADGRANETTAMEIALELGADEQALRDEMTNPANARQVEMTYLLAEALGITGTPSYVIGTELVPGALGADLLREKIDEARECAETNC